MTNLPPEAFTAADVVALYLHRGAFEPHLSDQDQELDPDRWCSHSASWQQAWQVVSQWVWNLRLELGHHLKPEPLRTTAFPPALHEPQAGQAPDHGYEPPIIGGAWKAGHFTGEDFALQPDGTVGCPAGKSLFPQERRREGDGSLRVVYEARSADCRACQMRPPCHWHGHQAQHPRRVSVLLHPRKGGSAPLLWRDWPLGSARRACMHLLWRQRVGLREPPAAHPPPPAPPLVLSRTQRAHYRLSWNQRLARTARLSPAAPPTLTLYGVPDSFAAFLGVKAQ